MSELTRAQFSLLLSTFIWGLAPIFVGMALESKSSGQACNILIHGIARDDTWNFTNLAGTGCLLYVGSGAVTQTKPTTAGHQVQIVGYALSDDEIMFNPNLPWAEI